MRPAGLFRGPQAAKARVQRERRLDREFLAPAQEVLTTPASPVGRNIAITICVLFAAALAVAWFGKVDIYAAASGRIQPVGRSKVIQPLDTGKVVAINVHNGSLVREGQVLVELDRTEPGATMAAASDQTVGLTAEIARRRLAIATAKTGRLSPAPTLPPDGLTPEYRAREQSVLDGDLAVLQTTVSGLRAKIAEAVAQRRAAELSATASQDVIGTLGQRVEMRRRLLQQGWESRANVIDATEDLQKEHSALASAQGAVLQADAARRTQAEEITETVAKFVSDNAQAMEAAQTKLDQVRQDLVKASAAVQHTRLVAPLDGTVQELDVTTLGQVVSSGQQLMTVVPRRAILEIEAMVPNKDIGFVKEGQPAVIKLDAFPFTRYGTVPGRVVRVSRDAVASSEAAQETGADAQPISAKAAAAAPDPKTQNLVYPVTIQMDRATIAVDGRDMPLAPGLSATVEIKTGKRRVLEYILSPLTEIAAGAGHER